MALCEYFNAVICYFVCGGVCHTTKSHACILLEISCRNNRDNTLYILMFVRILGHIHIPRASQGEILWKENLEKGEVEIKG